jgi:predicted oxidoreductase
MGSSDAGGSSTSDPFGFDENRSVVADTLEKIVPQSVARRALTVAVDTDRDTYAVGERVRFRVTVRNRLPLPVAVETPDRRLWGWTIDGELEASDEPRFADSTRETPGTLRLRGGETLVVERTWRGRFRRVRDDGPTRWVQAEPGVHELGVFLAYDGGPRATTTFEVEVAGDGAERPDG